MKPSKACIVVMALLFSAMAVSVYAANNAPGDAEYTLLTSIVTGNIGYFFGMFITFFGLYMAAVKGDVVFGVSLIILGSLVVLTPKLYDGMRDITCQVSEALGAPCGAAGPKGT